MMLRPKTNQTRYIPIYTFHTGQVSDHYSDVPNANSGLFRVIGFLNKIPNFGTFIVYRICVIVQEQ